MNPVVAVQDLRCEYTPEPLGLDTRAPRFSWKLMDAAASRGQRQTACQILVASSRAELALGIGDLWDVKLESEASVQIEYAGAPLRSGMVCYWKVRIWDSEQQVSEWSRVARFSMGPQSSADWRGEWIGMGSASEFECPWFRKTFTLNEPSTSAIVHVASVGYYELYVNGQKVGDAVLSPSVSNLGKRVLYSSYDIAALLRLGVNTIGIWAAAGWASYVVGDNWPDFELAKRPLLKAQAEIAAGEKQLTIASDASWKCSLSSLTHVGGWRGTDYGGEQIDLRRHVSGWASSELSDADWEHATAYLLEREVSADRVPPNRACETIKALSISADAAGAKIVMERVFSGWIEIKLRGTPDTSASIEFSMDENQTCQFNQRGLLTFDAKGEGTFCNRFSYHGIQYVTVQNALGPLQIEDVCGYRIGNDLERAGNFDCSNTLLKKIYDTTHNTYVNLTTGGYVSDCAHREKLGYGGDGTTSLEFALTTYEAAGLYTKWAQDWVDVQTPDGHVPNTAPVAGGGGSPAYGCFIVSMPWQVYLTYGDIRVLERTYPAMQSWLAYLEQKSDSEGLLLPFPGDWHFLGDWVSPVGEGGEPGRLLHNNLHYLYATRLIAKVARVLGKAGESAAYLEKAFIITNELNRRFFNPEAANYLNDDLVNLALPLVAEAVPHEYRALVAAKLESSIMSEPKLNTGLWGTYFLVKWLTESLRSDLMFVLATQATCPGYAYLLEAGYDTWPEEWLLRHPFGVSKVHGCLNGIGLWFQQGLAGIQLDPEHPGFKHFLVKPALVGDLSWVRAEVTSMYGKIVSAWNFGAERFTLHVEVPPNTSAHVYYPGSDPNAIFEGSAQARQASGVAFVRVEGERSVFLLQSGKYTFSSERSVGRSVVPKLS